LKNWWWFTFLGHPVYLFICCKWRRLHRAQGACASHFYKWLDTGAPQIEEQQTRNWPNCTDHHESAHQND